MSIVEKRMGKDGTPWGWDDRAGQWVELDPAAEGGTGVGNVGRAAVRGFRDVGQGITELSQTLPDNPIHPELLTPLQQVRGNERQLLEAQQAAGAQSAPIAEAVGGAAPEVLAGVGTGIATGGLGLVPAMVAQGLAGSAVGFMRPGDLTERATNAALGAVFAMVPEGAAWGAQAVRGSMLGLKLGEVITGRAAARSANELDAGLARVEAATADASVSGRSVGAAATPEGELGEQALRENRALDIDEATGAGITSQNDELVRRRVEERGYKSPLGAQTHLGSMARAAEAVDEYTLEGSINKGYRVNNQKMLARDAARAMGDPDFAAKEVIELEDLAMVRGRLENTYDALERQAPTIDAKAVAREIKSSIKPGGIFEDTKVEKWLNKAAETADKLEVEDGPTMMANLRRIRDMATEASKNGDANGAEQLLNLHERLSRIMERTADRQGNKAFAEEWKRANSQYRIMRMLESGASVSGTRDVNPKSLLNRMKRDPVNGGYGSKGPATGTPERDLWDLVRTMDKDQSHVPATGVRQLLVRQGAGAAKAAALGGAGLYGVGQLFGN